MPKATCLIITGMHRSGTSLVSETVSSLGIGIGTDLLEPNEFNPRGYFEDITVVEFHDQLLDALGRPWGSTTHATPLPSDWLSHPSTAKMKTALQSYLQGRLAEPGDIFAVKDPRIALFLPAWSEVAKSLGIHLRVLICIRDPEAVAQSLWTRDHISGRVSDLLWLTYVSSALTAAPRRATRLLFQSDWNSDPQAQVQRIADFAGVSGHDAPQPVFDPTLLTDTSATGFQNLPTGWNSALDMARAANGIPGAALRKCATSFLENATAVAQALLVKDDESHESRLARDLATYRAGYAEARATAQAALERASALSSTISEVSSKATEATRTYSAVLGRQSARLHNATEAEYQGRTALDAAHAKIARLNDLLQDSAETEQRTIAHLQATQAEVARLNDVLNDLQAQRDALTVEIANRVAAYETLGASHRNAKAEIDRLREILARRERNYDRAIAALKLARGNIQELVAGQDTSQTAHMRQTELLRQRESHLGDARAHLEEAEAQITHLRTALSQAEADLDNLRKWHLPSRVMGKKLKR